MGAYITGTSAISPQNTFDKDLYLDELVEVSSEYFQCIEPSYKAYVDPKLSRRMARIIKMGVTTAKDSLEEAGIEEPEAIITGTGMGCLKDTEKFLASIIENEEELLSPTSFIQSTHNTIGGQIALMLKCYQYNYTYVQRGHSFESALLDGMMMLEEGSKDVLVGGVDEVTPTFFDIVEKIGCISRHNSESAKQKNPELGEGAAFFVVSSDHKPGAYAEVKGLRTFYRPDNLSVAEKEVEKFLQSHSLETKDIDALMLGINGYKADDDWYFHLSEKYFQETPQISFKNLCGEYHTASAFALNLASHMLKKQKSFGSTFTNGKINFPLNNILIYNHYKQKNHSLILLKKCDPTG